MTDHLYVSEIIDGLTPQYRATPEPHMGAEMWIPRDAVRVKPLEWSETGREWRPWIESASCVLGLYTVRPNVDGQGCSFRLLGSHLLYGFPTIEDAKAAAQADFAARIMSALAALPAPDEGEQDEGEG